MFWPILANAYYGHSEVEEIKGISGGDGRKNRGKSPRTLVVLFLYYDFIELHHQSDNDNNDNNDCNDNGLRPSCVSSIGYSSFFFLFTNSQTTCTIREPRRRATNITRGLPKRRRSPHLLPQRRVKTRPLPPLQQRTGLETHQVSFFLFVFLKLY